MERVTDRIPVVKKLDLKACPKGKISKFWVQIASTGLGTPITVPVMVAKGLEDGPVLGLTAAVHGNELNGIPVIQRLFREIKAKDLRGTLVGVLAVNIPGLLNGTRKFNDGTDLNHVMPGRADGNDHQVYAHRVMDRIIGQFEYLVDLHTASFGRINSYYIRADMDNPVTRKMALLQNAQIIVHNPPMDGTLRGAAAAAGIHAITLEVGDPNKFQKGMIRSSMTGIHNLLHHLKMKEGEIEIPDVPTVLCDRSYWVYTDAGGILQVMPDLTDQVKAGSDLATLRNIFGKVIRDYKVPEDGIVIGKSIGPVNQTGGRILHLGILRGNQNPEDL